VLPSYWEDFVDRYGKDGVYWFFPKGGTADAHDFRAKFRRFAHFEGSSWTPATQHKIAESFRTATLSRAVEGTALPRMLKRVFENLGLCIVKENKPISLTPVGRAFLAETGLSKILDRQVWQSRLPNPFCERCH
jgi:hypothetical protein